jgi:hypothetical protein
MELSDIAKVFRDFIGQLADICRIYLLFSDATHSSQIGKDPDKCIDIIDLIVVRLSRPLILARLIC